MRWLAALALAGACAAAACSDSTPSASSPSSSSGSTASEPPAATLVFTGDPGVTGAIDKPSVTCSFPSLDGLQLAVLGNAADGTTLYRVAVDPDNVVVHVGANVNGTFVERDFEGTGVSQFDPTRGASLDTQLTEQPQSLGATTGVPGITSLKGSIACVNQTPGTSTVKVTGETPSGRFDAAPLQPVIVECAFSSDEVVALGVIQAVDSRRELVKVSLTSEGLGIDEELEPSGKRTYSGPPEAVTLTPTGASANGDAVEKANPTPHTLHVEGDAVCGTPLR